MSCNKSHKKTSWPRYANYTRLNWWLDTGTGSVLKWYRALWKKQKRRQQHTWRGSKKNHFHRVRIPLRPRLDMVTCAKFDMMSEYGSVFNVYPGKTYVESDRTLTFHMSSITTVQLLSRYTYNGCTVTLG